MILLLPSCFLRAGELSRAESRLRRGDCQSSYLAFHQIQSPGKKELAFALRAAEACAKTSKGAPAALRFYERLLEKISAGEARFEGKTAFSAKAAAAAASPQAQAPGRPAAFKTEDLLDKPWRGKLQGWLSGFRRGKDSSGPAAAASGEIRNLQKTLQKKAAEHAFYRLKHYEKAIKYYKQALASSKGGGAEAFSLQYHISESFFHLKKPRQALFELDKINLRGLAGADAQKAMLLKGRALLAAEDFDRAIPFLRRMADRFPGHSAFFRQYLALAFEGQKDLPSAIRELEQISPPSDFVRRKIRQLRRRLESQPGAAL